MLRKELLNVKGTVARNIKSNLKKRKSSEKSVDINIVYKDNWRPWESIRGWIAFLTKLIQHQSYLLGFISRSDVVAKPTGLCILILYQFCYFPDKVAADISWVDNALMCNACRSADAHLLAGEIELLGGPNSLDLFFLSEEQLDNVQLQPQFLQP